jgi:RsiW-degrading membrane proteinase PrsW (M82 family)
LNTPPEASGAAEAGAAGGQARQVSPAWQIGVALLAALGSVVGAIGSVVGELTPAALILGPFVGAPIIEEAMKPMGVILVLAARPWLLRGRMHIAALCALAGVTFGFLESLVYVHVYVDDPTDAFVLFRYSVTPALHGVASFIFGLGLNRKLIDWANGNASLRETGWRWFVAAMALHAAYNITAVVLEVTDVVEFEKE